ncbi:MAG TPA: hypothetical protein VD998_03040 [Verrucomicrobiae bacterium]|nr:hypothetical protein [Verrucomicrobiae bacterium]
MQENWENWVKADIKFIEGEIAFFEDFVKRQWSDFEISEGSNRILEMQRRDKFFLEEALRLGDYPNAAA